MLSKEHSAPASWAWLVLPDEFIVLDLISLVLRHVYPSFFLVFSGFFSFGASVAGFSGFSFLGFSATAFGASSVLASSLAGFAGSPSFAAGFSSEIIKFFFMLWWLST